MIDRGQYKRGRREDQKEAEKKVLETLEKYHDPLALPPRIDEVIDDIDDKEVKIYLETYRGRSVTVSELINELDDYSPKEEIYKVKDVYNPVEKISDLLEQQEDSLRSYLERY